MFKVMIGFFKAIGTLAKPWWVWIGLLVLVNGVMPWVFIGTLEAKLVLAAFIVAGGLQMAIFRFKGFAKILGIGHIIPWLPLLIWLGLRFDGIGREGLFGQWLLALIVLDGISLVIDSVDVIRYLAGERTPAATLESVSES
jgi:hypothetical protein